ncbi:hypothetical protein BGZ89_007578, partial [Linnemannia elongata]
MNRVLHDDGIWKDKQGLGVGPSALGSSSSYLQRYLIGNDDDSFPTMLSTSSSALDLAKIPHSSGLRHPGGHDSGRTSEWPQYNNKPLADRIPTAPHMPQRTNSLVGYGLTNNPEESLKSALPKLTSSYSTSEIPTRFGKGPLSAFDDLSEAEHHQGLMMKSDIIPGEVCLQFQQQGYCPRGDLCNYIHTHALPGTARSAAGMPLSPGLGMTVGTMAGSATFYARANTSVAGGSTSSLVNGTAFPFTVTPNGF